jgi:hypothetical protein
MASQMKASIEELRVGMFIHLDLGWWAHPFALSSFVVSSPDQVATIRSLGLKRLRWSPERSQPAAEPVAADAALTPGETAAVAPPPVAAPCAANDGDARARRRQALAAQREATRVCQRQYAESARAWTSIAESLGATPVLARDTAEALTRALLDKMMVDQDMCIRVLAEGSGDRSALHALNVAVISLLMGRIFGFDAPRDDRPGRRCAAARHRQARAAVARAPPRRQLHRGRAVAVPDPRRAGRGKQAQRMGSRPARRA